MTVYRATGLFSLSTVHKGTINTSSTTPWLVEGTSTQLLASNAQSKM